MAEDKPRRPLGSLLYRLVGIDNVDMTDAVLLCVLFTYVPIGALITFLAGSLERMTDPLLLVVKSLMGIGFSALFLGALRWLAADRPWWQRTLPTIGIIVVWLMLIGGILLIRVDTPLNALCMRLYHRLGWVGGVCLAVGLILCLIPASCLRRW